MKREKKTEIEYIKIPKYYKNMVIEALKEERRKKATRSKTERGYYYISKTKEAKRIERIIKYLEKE
ncbi:MAG: hypothetical protein IJH55_09980 [Romboutsia sp.]|nr:hypothetical protein [Romboutsia sp.]